jgi:hypothetical protein
VGNDPLDSVDDLGLEGSACCATSGDGSNDSKMQHLLDAVWFAVQHAVGGNEWSEALKAVGGCNTLGLLNKWVQLQLTKCQACAYTDDASKACDQKWQPSIDKITDIWDKHCSKAKG